jgi:hypothetical protein
MRVLLVAVAVLGLAACSPPAAEPMLGGPPGQAVLRYRPAWVPPQVVEDERTVTSRRRVQWRTWRQPQGIQSGPRVNFVVSAQPIPGIDETAKWTRVPVDINGIRGHLVVRPGLTRNSAQVAWNPVPGERVTVIVEQLPDEAEVALRIARSTVPDLSPMFGDPFTVNWAPGGAENHHSMKVIGSSPADWTLHYDVGRVVLRIRAGGCEQTEGLARVRVRATTGWFFEDRQIKLPMNSVRIPLDDGTCLLVDGGFSRQQLIRVANTLQLRPVSAPWVGAR